jgi:hypothetical protein
MQVMDVGHEIQPPPILASTNDPEDIMIRFGIIACALLMIAGAALAETVTIEFHGEVEYNQINSGVFADVNSGDLVLATFTVESDNFVDSDTYGVRSFPIDLGSFALTIGTVGPIPLVDPQPDGLTSYFVLRNDDPAADGFFVGNDPEWPYINPALDVPAQIDPYFGFHWEVGYEGDVLASRDILDAVGTYDYTGLTSFYTTIADAWADAMGLIYTQTVISVESVAVENTTWSEVKALFE